MKSVSLVRQETEADPMMRRITRLIKGRARSWDKIFDTNEDIVQAISILRSMGCRIVYTSGVWDLLHIGHCKYIEAGRIELEKRFSDAEHWIVVVGVDGDALTKERKGPRRPIVPERERLETLSHMGVIDMVAIQYGKRDIIQLVKPDLLLISQSTKDIPPSVYQEFKPLCGGFVVLEPQAETSTSAKVRNLFMDGAETLYEPINQQIEGFVDRLHNEAEALKSGIAESVASVRKLNP